VLRLQEEGDLTEARLELLRELVGHGWLDSRLRSYREFRRRFSPESRWWHRSPELSPVVPLVYWAKPGPRYFADQPYAVWRGDPTAILARLTAAIVEFQGYWQALPNDRGKSHLRHVLRRPWRFFGFRHELRLATHLTGSGYSVEPTFFDPASHKGQPDITVYDGPRTYDIQCKAANPSTATDMPYDVFQFFAGAFVRLVADSGGSYFLHLHMRRKVDAESVGALVSLVRRLLRARLATPRLSDTQWDLQLMEIGGGPGRIAIEETRLLALQRFDELLYSDFEPLAPKTSDRRRGQVAISHITGKRGHGLEAYVFGAAEKAAKEYVGDNPLVVSVNVYQETDMTEYMNGTRVGPSYYDWTQRFFAKYPHVALLLISSNYDKYLEMEPDKFGLATKYLAVESPNWEDVLPQLGVNVRPWQLTERD